jgi:hypothetical protein
MGLSQEMLGISAAGSRFTHARRSRQVKPRWADGTVRESVWECRSSPGRLDGEAGRYQSRNADPQRFTVSLPRCLW